MTLAAAFLAALRCAGSALGQDTGTLQQRPGSIHNLLDVAYVQARNMLGQEGTVIMGAAGMAPATPPNRGGLPETWFLYFRNGQRDVRLLYKDGLLADQEVYSNDPFPHWYKCAPIDILFLDTPQVGDILEKLGLERNGDGRWLMMLGNARTTDCASYLRYAHAWPAETLPSRHAGKTLWVANNGKEIVFIDAKKGKLVHRAKAPHISITD